MPIHRIAPLRFAMLALAMLALLAPPHSAAAAETITCAVCGKKVPKDKAIRVILNGRVYYVCSQACLEKLKKKESEKNKKPAPH